MAGGKYQPLTLTPVHFSLTDGTSIPAPPDSPPQSPRPPTPAQDPPSSYPTPISAVFPHHGQDSPSSKRSSTSNLQRTNGDENGSTLSPTSPIGRRPSSVRKFLGFSSSDNLKSERLGTANSQRQPSLTRKKSTSWFGRRTSTFAISSVPEGKEKLVSPTNSTVASPPTPPPQKQGPPPPALPDLKTFGVSEDTLSLGADDLFHNIK